MHPLNLAATIPVTGAEGPGKRFAVWVQGCPFRCPGCCNPQYLEFQPALETTAEALFTEVCKVREQIEGVTLIGGEPFSQAAGLAVLAELCRDAGLSVMTFSGYTWDQLTTAEIPAGERLLAATDLLIAGPYVAAQHSKARRWIGSENQTIHYLSPRYHALRTAWPAQGNSIEIRLRGGQISINGFPHKDITLLSRSQADAQPC
jgi:anaerobic ribonucleoside-triphosphate reductase activating protein